MEDWGALHRLPILGRVPPLQKELSSRKIIALQGWQLGTTMVVYFTANQTVSFRPT